MKISPWATGAMKVAVFSAALAIPGTGIAMAAGPISATGGNGSILGGNQINLPVSAPVDICGNGTGILGPAAAGCDGGASVSNGGRSGSGSEGIERTSGNGSILGGNQVNAPVSTPVSACGNSVAAGGEAFSGCRGGASTGGTHHTRGRGSGGLGDFGGSGGGTSGPSVERTSGNGSIVGGNQVNAPVSAPVDICGNALALLGESRAACAGGASVTGAGSGAAFERTSGNGSIGGGNQVNAPISAPIDACGNSTAILGSAFAGCRGGASVTGHSSRGGVEETSGSASLLGGNQVTAPVGTPVSACGNSVAAGSEALSNCRGVSKFGTPGTPGTPGNPGMPETPGTPGNPGMPGTPGTPGDLGTPGTPGAPGNPRTPGTPGTPGTSDRPGGTTSTSGSSPQTTTASLVGSSSGGLLPTTGADLAGMLVAGLGAIGAGAVSMVAIRRRRVAGRD